MPVIDLFNDDLATIHLWDEHDECTIQVDGNVLVNKCPYFRSLYKKILLDWNVPDTVHIPVRHALVAAEQILTICSATDTKDVMRPDWLYRLKWLHCMNYFFLHPHSDSDYDLLNGVTVSRVELEAFLDMCLSLYPSDDRLQKIMSNIVLTD